MNRLKPDIPNCVDCGLQLDENTDEIGQEPIFEVDFTATGCVELSESEISEGKLHEIFEDNIFVPQDVTRW